MRNPSETLRAFWGMPEPWEDATARKTLRQADLYQPGSSPDSHAGALLGQPLPPPSSERVEVSWAGRRLEGSEVRGVTVRLYRDTEATIRI